MRRVLLLALLGAVAACSDPAPEPPADGGAAPSAVPVRNSPGRSYERTFVFTTLTGDSAFIVPWVMRATTRPGGVRREARGWLARSGTWEAFYAEQWQTPPTRAPMRILPHGALRLVVSEGNGVEGIIFEAGPRNLGLAFGDELASWAGPRGEGLQLVGASVLISEQRVGGIALDMSRQVAGDVPFGDWAFLTSGDSLQVVMTGDSEHTETYAPEYRAWARLDFRDLSWPNLEVDWTEIRAFQPARRDVPVAWGIRGEDRALTGVLSVLSAEIKAGEGPGPVLPLYALFEVSGRLTIEGRDFPVRGIFQHERR